MRVCLISPPSGFLLDERVFLSLGILKVGAALEQAKVKVDHIDLSGIANYEDAIRDYKPEDDVIFALTATTPQMPAAIRIRDVIKERDAKVIIGGPHVTLIHAAAKRGVTRAQEALSYLHTLFDCIVAGDGEKAIFEALYTKGLVDADDPKSVLWQTSKDFTESPWPARHLVDVDSYHYTVDGEKALSMVSQLGCPFESITCDSFIFTSKGFETINEFRKRQINGINVDNVIAYNILEPVATRSGTRTATVFLEESVRDVYEVKHKFGIPLKGTSEHLVLAVKDEELVWKCISELKSGDWIACKFPDASKEYVDLKTEVVSKLIPPGGFNSKEIDLPTSMDEDLAWLVGFILGDGCLPADGRPQIHVCVTPDVEDRLIKIVKEKFGLDLKIYASNSTEKMHHGWINSRIVYEFFIQSLGVSPFNKLNVPEVIRISPKSVIQAFLEGLWDADGYTDKEGRSYLCTANHEFGRQVAMLLLMVGEIPFLVEIDSRGKSYSPVGKHTRVGIAQGERFPTDKGIYKSKKSGQWHWRTKKSANRTGIRRRTLKESGLSHPLDIKGIFYSLVKSVEYVGKEQVFDLTVPEEENFVANGIIVHNCGFCGGRLSPMLRRIRTRTSDNVIAEMMYLHEKYGVDGLMYYDDELNVNKGLVPLMHKIKETGVDWRLRGFVKAELFNEEQAEAMYAAGFRWLLCGFESAHPRILKNINKKATLEDNTNMLRIAHKYGLKVKALMSFGHPGESEETILATRDWLLQEKPDDFDCTVITLYPGTPYWDQSVCVEEPVYRYEFNGDSLYSMNIDFNKEQGYYKGKPGEYHAFVWTDYLNQEQLVKLRDQVEAEVREKLNIPYPSGAAALAFEHSMGQALPDYILKKGKQ